MLKPIFIFIFTLSATFASELPDLSGSFNKDFSIKDEKELAHSIKRNLKKDNYIIEDLEALSYLESIGTRLHTHSDLASIYGIEFFLIKSPTINAFAAPGGIIGVNTGFILATATEDEMASVIAHEIGHLSQRHFARTMQSFDKFGIATVAAFIAAILVAGENADAAQAILYSTIAGTNQIALNTIRQHEKEADRVAIGMLAKADFTPQSLAYFFEKLEKQSFDTGDVPEYLRTHPLTENRIAEAYALAERYPLILKGQSLDYLLFKQRIRILAAEDKSSLFKTIQYEYNKSPDISNSYAYALVLNQLKKYNQAEKVLYPLQNQSNPHLWIRLEYAKTLEYLNKNQQALENFKKIYTLYPYSFPVLHAYIYALIRNQQVNYAKNILDDHRQDYIYKSEFYNLVFEVEKTAQNHINAFEARSQYFLLEGYIEEAAVQLEFALKQPGLDGVRRAKLQAKLERIMEKFRRKDKKK